MKKAKRNIIIGTGVVLVLTISYLFWPEKKVSAPEDTIVLDKSKNYNSEFYLSEDNYEYEMVNTVEPYLQQYRKTGYFEGYDGEKLYYEQYIAEQSKGHIVIVHGFTDATYKFREMMYYFMKSGYSVSALDHRGHGYSYREEENLSKVTIDSFEEYKDDLKIFVNEVVKPVVSDNEQLYMYAHSMGGAIATLLLEEENKLFDAAVLTSPMMEVEFSGIPNNIAMLITNVSKATGNEDEYTVGTSDYEEIYDYENSSYTSEARYKYVSQYAAADEYYRMSGGNYKWLAAAVNATKDIRKSSGRYTTDTLLFQAENDTTVGPNGQNAFAKSADNVQIIKVEGAKHSILFSDNATLIPYVNTILEFYDEHLK